MGRAVTNSLRMTCDDITFIYGDQKIHITTLLKYSKATDSINFAACAELCKRLPDPKRQHEHDRELFRRCFEHEWLCGQRDSKWLRLSGIRPSLHPELLGSQQSGCLKGSLKAADIANDAAQDAGPRRGKLLNISGAAQKPATGPGSERQRLLQLAMEARKATSLAQGPSEKKALVRRSKTPS